MALHPVVKLLTKVLIFGHEAMTTRAMKMLIMNINDLWANLDQGNITTDTTSSPVRLKRVTCRNDFTCPPKSAVSRWRKKPRMWLAKTRFSLWKMWEEEMQVNIVVLQWYLRLKCQMLKNMSVANDCAMLRL